MSENQRPLEESGLPRQMGRMVEDWSREYRGGPERLELAKGHPDGMEEALGIAQGLPEDRAPDGLVAAIARAFARFDVAKALEVEVLRENMKRFLLVLQDMLPTEMAEVGDFRLEAYEAIVKY